VRLAEIARFEIAYRLCRASTWVFAVMLTVLPLGIMQALANEPEHLNSPISTATAVALLGMVGMLITAAIFGDAATRDAHISMCFDRLLDISVLDADYRNPSRDAV